MKFDKPLTTSWQAVSGSSWRFIRQPGYYADQYLHSCAAIMPMVSKMRKRLVIVAIIAVIVGGQFIAFVQDGETRSVGRFLLAFLITASPLLR